MKWQWALCMMVRILTVKAKDRNCLELSLFLSSHDKRSWSNFLKCQSGKISTSQPRLKLRNNYRKVTPFPSPLTFFTNNLHKRNLRHTAPSCLHTTSTFSKGVSSSTSLYRSKPQMPLPQGKYCNTERTVSQQNHLLQQNKTQGHHNE